MKKKRDKNIIFIGMPGCGKTTIGKLIADKLNRKFCDVDQYIEKKHKKSIPDIFKIHGEEHFRKLESYAVEEVSKYSGFVILTGGGVIKSNTNIEFLRENGIIFFINRAVENIISDIEIDGRPLLMNGKEKLYELYDERINLYKKSCHYEIINDKCLATIVDKIMNILVNI